MEPRAAPIIGAKVHSCSYCEYETHKKSNLQAHELTHTAEKPFACEICGFSTTQKGNLKTHMLRHSDEKPFKCTVKSCTFSTKRKSILQRHMSVHSKKKRYSCENCRFRTNSKVELLKHKSVHSKFDFECKACEFSTSYKNVLAKHMFKFHTNIPFNYPYWNLNSRTVRWKDKLQTPINKRVSESITKSKQPQFEQTQSKKKYHPLIYEPNSDCLSIMSIPELLDEWDL